MPSINVYEQWTDAWQQGIMDIANCYDKLVHQNADQVTDLVATVPAARKPILLYYAFLVKKNLIPDADLYDGQERQYWFSVVKDVCPRVQQDDLVTVGKCLIAIDYMLKNHAG